MARMAHPRGSSTQKFCNEILEHGIFNAGRVFSTLKFRFNAGIQRRNRRIQRRNAFFNAGTGFNVEIHCNKASCIEKLPKQQIQRRISTLKKWSRFYLICVVSELFD